MITKRFINVNYQIFVQDPNKTGVDSTISVSEITSNEAIAFEWAARYKQKFATMNVFMRADTLYSIGLVNEDEPS